jgi:predicted transcriptional regulator
VINKIVSSSIVVTYRQYYYRNRIDIIEDILDISNGNEVRQIEILSKAKITHAMFKEYMPFLIQSGLIEYVRHQSTFKTTAKGLDFLSLCNKMKALLLSLPYISTELLIPMISENK